MTGHDNAAITAAGDAIAAAYPGLGPETGRKMAALARPHLAAAERERIYAELGNDHYVIFTEDRWTIEHSVECRLSGHMHECSEHEAIALAAREYNPAMAGRWRITGISDEGLPSLERAERAS